MATIRDGSWNGRPHTITGLRRVLALRIPALALILFLSGCVHWPEVATDCEAYGVVERSQPMGTVLHMRPLGVAELQERCWNVRKDAATISRFSSIRGCVIPGSNGEVYGYYARGDQCAMYHEMCHAIHGVGHTERYLKDVESHHARPYCPENQLKLTAMN